MRLLKPLLCFRHLLPIALAVAGSAAAVPVAVSDSYTVQEDTVLNVSGTGGGSFLNDGFPANLSGWIFANAIFGGTQNGGTSNGSWTGTSGNPAGGLTLTRAFAGTALGTRSAGVSKTFILAASQQVRVTFDAQVTLSGASTSGYGAVRSRVGTSGGTTELARQTGNGTLGWQTYTYTTGSLASGTHTLQVGVWCASSNGGTANVLFDNIKVESLSGGAGGLLSNDTGGVDPVTAVKASDPANGAVTLNSDGSFTYTPAANFSGTDSFTYRAVDSTGQSAPATVTLTVTPVNDAPVAQDNTYSVNEDTTLNVSAPGVMGNDIDPDGNSITAALRAPAVNGTVTLNANGSFTYVPVANFSGTDSFTYRVNDGSLNSPDATVSITVNPVNSAPVSLADSYRTPANTPLTVSLTSPDGQPTTPVSFVADGSSVPIGDPAEIDLPVWRYLDDGSNQGTAWRGVAYNDSAWLTGKGELGYGDGPERTIVGFGPDSNNKYVTTYFRTAFEVEDRSTLANMALFLMRDDAAVVYLNGTEIYRDQTDNGFPGLPADPAFNLPASASISNADEAALRDLSIFLVPNATQYLVEGANVLAVEVHQATANSSDLSMDLRLTAQRVPYSGVLYNDIDTEGSPLTAQLVSGPTSGTLTLNANGTFTYTPALNFTGMATFIYRANDGGLNSANTTVSIEVTAAGNVPPVAVNDSYSVNEDALLTVNAPGVLGNDTDLENSALTAQLISGPLNGTLTLSADGSFTYRGNLNYFGADSFTYRARDAADDNSEPATVNITVTPVNDAPVANPDSYGTSPGVFLSVNAANGVLTNDTDREGSNLTVQLVTPPASGSLTLFANGGFNYTPPAGFFGVRTFSYRAFDGNLSSAATMVTINISAAPVAVTDAYTATEDSALAVNAPGVLSNDSDPDGGTLSAVLVSPPVSGSILLNSDGSFTYTPVENFNGAASFTYQASDGGRLSAPVTVSLTVTAVNDAPLARNDSYSTGPGLTISTAAPAGVLANDSDAESAPLTAAQLTAPAHGGLTFSPDGSFTYVPDPGFSGTDSFLYRISDGVLFSESATATIVVAQADQDIVINEIMYRAGSGFPEDTAREFIELHNRGLTPVDLTGWTISAGVTFAFPAGTILAPGGYLVAAANVAAFQANYPGVTNVIGGWTGSLSNGGEKIELSDSSGEAQNSVSYSSEGDWAQRIRETTFNGWEWSTLADGGNRSMELRNPQLPNDEGQNWTVSSTIGGTPGAANGGLSANIAPMILDVSHSPAVPTPTDRVLITCELKDESPDTALTATLFWRDATSASPGAWQLVPMSTDGNGHWFAPLDPRANLSITEFYVSAADGTGTRTWPAPTSEGQNANCQYQVSSEAPSANTDMYWLVMTAAENSAFVTTTASDNSGNKIDRQFNNTLIVQRGAETTIRYRCDMRIRGNSSRDHTSTTPSGAAAPPMRIRVPADDDLDGNTKFNLNPRNSALQYLGMRLFQAAGVRAPDVQPVEMRRNGVEYSRPTGTTADFGLWVRMEDISSEMINNHWPLADDGQAYKKGRPDRYWRATQPAPANPDLTLDGWIKQNGSAANDWSDLRNFFSVWQTACQPHFPGTTVNDVAGSGGASTGDIGAWNGGAFDAAQIASVETVADLDQWARWFAIMTILQDNETNVSNGQDDDYGIYFEPRLVGAALERRLQFIPHDLDTVFGLGDSPLAFNARGLYDMTESGSVFRPLLPLFGTSTTPGNAAFLTKYHNALRELFGSVFNADTTADPNPPFYQLVDYHLSSWAPADTRTAIKTFVTQRRNYLLGLIGSGATTPPAGTSVPTLAGPRGSLYISEVLASNVAAHVSGGLYPDIIELRNAGAASLNLAGMSLTDDPLLKTKFVFPAGTTIPSGGYLLIYGDSATAVPGLHAGFGLSADGDALYLYNTVASGQALVDSVVFGLQAPDFSIGRTGAALDTWGLCTPTIGAANTAVAALADPATLRINEWLGNADYRAPDDFVELYNGAAQPVALGGMRLTDDFINYPSRHVLPPLSFMGAGTWVEFEVKGGKATPGNARELPFSINATYGSVALLGANGSQVDLAETTPQFRDISVGRVLDGTGPFGAQPNVSPGYSNAQLPEEVTDLLNFLRITEMMYNPSSSARAEYIEFRNVSDLAGAPVALNLSGVRFVQGITYTFPEGTTLAPGAYLVITNDAARFSAQFPSVTALGPYSNSLSNGGERVALEPAVVNTAILDFSYADGWYPSTDGGGDALQIVNPAGSPAMWDREEGWQATPPNPGGAPPYSVYAGLDTSGAVGAPVFLDGALNLGTFLPSSVLLAWSADSGPGLVTFTTANYADANARFSAPGVYVLRLTATAPGPVITTDLITVTVYETYDAWAARELASQPAAGRLPGADPDGDGVLNVTEFILGGNPSSGSSTGLPTPVPAGGQLSFTWQRNLLADPHIEIIPQLSEDLQSWQEGEAVLQTTMAGTTGNQQTWISTDAAPAGARSRAFGRIMVVMP